jgi:hypothetical protein
VNPSVQVVVGVRTMTTFRLGATVQNCRAFSLLEVIANIDLSHRSMANNGFAIFAARRNSLF